MRGELLRIDVKAEIRKLTGRRFKSAGDYAVELVKYAASCKALRIDVEVNAGKLTISHDGGGMEEAHLKRLAAVFDSRRPDEQRHQAIVDLEENHGLELIAAFSVGNPKVTIVDVIGGKKYGLEFNGSRVRRIDAGRARGFSITVKGSRRKPALEKKMIKEACKYSLIPVQLNGERINQGPRLDDTLIKVDLRNNRMLGVVGLPIKSNLTRVVRLRHGIRVEEIVRAPSNGLVFHAVVDEQDSDLKATLATLRRGARRLFSRIAERFSELGDAGQERALELLFDRFRHTQESELMNGVAAFPRVGATPVEMREVKRLAEMMQVYAIDGAEALGQYDLEGRVVFRLDAGMRSFLERELKIKFITPPLLSERYTLLDRLRNIKHGIASFFRDLFGGGPGTPLRHEDLMKEEAEFLEAVNAEVRSGGFSLPGEARPFGIRVRMAEGQRRIWIKVKRKDERSEYRISRTHPQVSVMVEAYASNHSYIYPALLLLTDGWDGYSDTRIFAQGQVLRRYGA